MGASGLHPVDAPVNGLGTLLIQVFLSNALAVILSTCIFVGGCGCPISVIVVRSGTASCAFINYAPIFSSAADAMTFVMILYTL